MATFTNPNETYGSPSLGVQAQPTFFGPLNDTGTIESGAKMIAIVVLSGTVRFTQPNINAAGRTPATMQLPAGLSFNPPLPDGFQVHPYYTYDATSGSCLIWVCY